MGSKADNDEVFKALSTVGNKLKKIGVIIPAIQEELSTKINRDDLSKWVDDCTWTIFLNCPCLLLSRA